jgi:hypothetical protein
METFMKLYVGFEVLTAMVMKRSIRACYLLHAGLLLVLFFDLEDEGDIFLRIFS